MALLDVKGVRINFPFNPYPCQVTYMEKVLQCLQQEENGVLESPTGTGKTFCLLCSTLAWLEGRKAQAEFSRQAGAAAMLAEAGKENLEQSTLAAMAASLQKSTGSNSWGSSEFVVPKIIYASRTHSQLSQAVQELKRTAYNGMKTAVIGSREQLCINEQVKKEKNNNTKVHMCRAKVSARKCHYYNVLEDLKRNTEARQVVGSVADIEDLVSHGTKSKICPYYLARELKADADIIFMPYNYLLDPKSRRAHGIELQGNIVIFDEAHNLERICEDSASFELSSVDLATAIEETTQLGVKLTEMVSTDMDTGDTEDTATMPEFTLEDIIKLKKTLLELEELIDSEPLKNKEIVKPGLFMFELMAKVNITFNNKNFVIDLMDKMIAHFNSDGTSGALHSKGTGLSKVADALKITFNQEPGEGASFSQHRQSLAQHYKVHIQLKEGNSQKKKKLDSWASAGGQDKAERVLSYWCFSPGYSMQELKNQGVKSIILTSGTLSPIESFTAEMQIPFNVRLENPHVIEKHQVWVGTLNCGPDGTTLNSNYQNRFTDSYQMSLGNSIVNFARVVPNGLLVFFPSYPVMEKSVQMWQNSNIWERIMAYKPVVVEPRGKDAFTEAMNDFYEKINDTKLNGAIFMAVCRGKVSEGLDFADNNGRAVVLTGLPFPPMKDPRVILKMQHLDGLHGKQGYQTLTGQQWYRQQATRAVNQAIGRVIRHKDDFGAIMLCDSRFSSAESVRNLPVWVRPFVTKYDNFGRGVRDMLSFFKVAEKTLPVPRAGNTRQKGGATGAGCVGAYFEPTVSRRAANVEQASSVTCHVPGLGRSKTSEEDMTSLRWQYGGASTPGQQKKGLLNALDSSEKHMGTPTCFPRPPSSSEGAVKIHSRKKKIVIKPNGASTPSSSRQKDAPTETSASAAGTKTSTQKSGTHLQLAENYLAEVKAVLTSADYKRFSSVLQQYKRSESLSTVTPVLGDLFTSTPGHFHLFRKFYRFVRPKHKAEFDQLCVSLTGESCGYRPEHAITSKRLAPTEDQASKEKRQKLDSASSSSGSSLGQWSASHTSGSQSIKDCLSSKATLCTPQQKPSADNTTTSSSQSGSKTAQGKSCNTSAGVPSNDDASLKTDSDKKHTQRTLTAGSGSGACQGTSYVTAAGSDAESSTSDGPLNLDLEKIHKMQNDVNRFHPKTGYLCRECQKEAHVPFQLNQCEHVCCFVCWRKILEGDKLCPGECGQLVKKRNLRQLLFASGDEVGTPNTSGSTHS